jgi:hypothetical protein
VNASTQDGPPADFRAMRLGGDVMIDGLNDRARAWLSENAMMPGGGQVGALIDGGAHG